MHVNGGKRQTVESYISVMLVRERMIYYWYMTFEQHSVVMLLRCVFFIIPRLHDEADESSSMSTRQAGPKLQNFLGISVTSS